MTNQPQEAELPRISGYLGRSFFAISLGIIVYALGALLIHGLVIANFFPAEFEALSKQAEDVQPTEPESKQGQDSDTDDQPRETESTSSEKESSKTPKADETHRASLTFWFVGLAIHITAAFSGGWICNRIAPTIGMGHVMFVAAMVFFSALQASSDGVLERPAWIMALFTFCAPFAVMVGGWLGLKPVPAEDLESLEEPEVEAGAKEESDAP